ncbi:MAG: MmcQ/YjbR family DNA-binding protein [Bacteroidetes bacterium]|nr:MmcQ/YjbR family DNA-binding protein [Bacteroidota bacterium]
MVTAAEAKAMALALPDTGEKPHFERTAFTVKKKIFATLLEKDNTLNLLLTPEEQFIICPPDSKVIYPVPNKWGEKGATTIFLPKASKKLVQQGLKKAYDIRKEK